MEGNVRRITLLLSLLIPVLILLNPATGKTQISEPVNLTGYLQTLAVDEVNEATGMLRSGFLYYLKTEDDKLYRLEDPNGIVKGKPSEKITVSGTSVDSKTILVGKVELLDSRPILRALAAEETLPETIGEQKTLVALFNYPDKPYQLFTIAEVEGKILTNPDSLDNFIRENSYGKTWLTADFIDWQGLPNNSTHYVGPYSHFELLEDSIATIDSIIDFRNYGRLIFIYADSDAISWGGKGTTGKWNLSSPGDGNFEASVMWLEEGWVFGSAIAHAFGYNLGFSGASSVFSIPESLLDPTFSTGAWRELSDFDDTMGNAYYHYSAIWETQAQWIEPFQIQGVLLSGQYVLDQFELPSPGWKVLKIPVGKDKAGNDTYYWVEYRSSNGTFDRGDSVQIRVHQNSTYTNTDDSWPAYWTTDSIKYEMYGSGGSISGRVTDESDGTGIGNIETSVSNPSCQCSTSTKTDSFGNYWIGGLPAGGYYVQTFNDSGYVDEYYDNVANQGTARFVNVTEWANTPNINFSLVNGGSISGRLTRESDGGPVSFQTGVYVYDTNWNYAGSGGPTIYSNGNYVVSGLPAGSYYVKTSGYQDYIDEYYNNVTSKSGATLVNVTQGIDTPDINFSLAIGGSISGRVTKDSDGTGIGTIMINV